MTAWKNAVESGWTFSGTDVSNQLELSMNVSISFTLQSGGAFNNNWASTYDNYVTMSQASNIFSHVTDGNTGVFRTDIGDESVIHEVGHFMGAPDMYRETFPNGVRMTTPDDGWSATIMGGGGPGSPFRNATKKDANLVLKSLRETTHLFE